MPSINRYLKFAQQNDASDLHIATGSPPLLRLHGELVRMKHEPFSREQTKSLLLEILSEEQRDEFTRLNDLDFSHELPGVGRFRVNYLKQRLGYNACFRVLSDTVPTLDDLNMPEQLEQLAEHHRGLVLVTGPAGCGKTTTLAALVDHINSRRREHILTVEDPIEYQHENKKGLVNQRQVGKHTESFSSALRAALREDPDVILIGEMRDLETISMAITSAETGHLVLGTLHTSSGAKTIDRILDAFPPDQQSQVRAMLSESLRGVVSQQLVKRKDGKGRVAAVEILIATPSLSGLIRDKKTFQIPTVMQMGKSAGMQSMDQALEDLLRTGVISGQEAYARAFDKSAFERYKDQEA